MRLKSNKNSSRTYLYLLSVFLVFLGLFVFHVSSSQAYSGSSAVVNTSNQIRDGLNEVWDLADAVDNIAYGFQNLIADDLYLRASIGERFIEGKFAYISQAADGVYESFYKYQNQDSGSLAMALANYYADRLYLGYANLSNQAGRAVSFMTAQLSAKLQSFVFNKNVLNAKQISKNIDTIAHLPIITIENKQGDLTPQTRLAAITTSESHRIIFDPSGYIREVIISLLPDLLSSYMRSSPSISPNPTQSPSATTTTLSSLQQQLTDLQTFVSQNVTSGYQTPPSTTSGGGGSGGTTTIIYQVGGTSSTLTGTKLTVGNTTYDEANITASGSSTYTINPNNGTGTVAISGNETISKSLTITSNLTVNGTVNFSGQSSSSYFYGQPGTAASPSFAFGIDKDTGMFRPAANTLGFSTLGVERLRVDSNGNIGIGTTSPTTALDIEPTTLGLSALKAVGATGTTSTSPGAGTGGGITLTGGTGGVSSFGSSRTGGGITLTGGNAGNGTNAGTGGGITLTGGNGAGGSGQTGGPINITAGNGDSSGGGNGGGKVNIIGGDSGSGTAPSILGQNPGSIVLRGGVGYSGQNGGDLQLQPGLTNGGGSIGLVMIAPQGGFTAIGSTTRTSKFSLVDSGIGSASSGSFSIRSSNTLGSIASISGISLTSGNALTLQLPNSGFTGKIINAQTLAGTSLFTFDANGNLGIGKSAPTTKLDVNGNASISDAMFLNSSTHEVGINTTSPVALLDIKSDSTHNPLHIFDTNNSDAFYIDNVGNTYSNASFQTLGNNVDTVEFVGLGATGQTSDLMELIPKSSSTYFLVNNQGNLGIGSTTAKYPFTLKDTAAGVVSSASFSIFSSKTLGSVASISAISLTTGSVFNIRVPASTSSSATYLLVKDTANIVYASLGSGGRLALARDVRSDGATSTCTGVGVPSGGCIDYAESMPTRDQSLTAGDLIAIDASDSAGFNIIKSNKAYDSNLLGIVSTNPGFLITGNSVESGANTRTLHAGTVPVALAGRVPVRVSLENGEIKPGDYLTSSATKPGYAMKASKKGRVVGMALEPATQAHVTDSTTPLTILVFINPHYAGQELDANGSLATFDSTNNQLLVGSNTLNVSTLFSAIYTYLKDNLDIVLEKGLIKVAKIVVEELQAGTGSFDSIQTKTGVTIYDTATHEPYCLSVENGISKTIKGVCGDADNQAMMTPAAPIPPDLTPSSSTTPSPTASIAPNDSPSPESTLSATPIPTGSPSPSSSPDQQPSASPLVSATSEASIASTPTPSPSPAVSSDTAPVPSDSSSLIPTP